MAISLHGCRGWGVHRRWILVNAVLGAGLVNIVVNGAIAWLSVHGRATVPLWQAEVPLSPSVLGDVVSTSFVLPFTTCLLSTAAVRRELHAGKLTRLRQAHVWWPLTALPSHRVRRGLAFGCAAVPLAATPVAAILVAFHTEALSQDAFLVFKVVYAVGLGAVVTPLIAWRAMADNVGAG